MRLTTTDASRYLKKQAVDAFDSLPTSVKYNPQDLTNRNVDPVTIYRRLTVQLEHLQSIFFAERMLAKRGRPDDGQLLRTSFAMVTHTLIFWTQQERLSSVCPQIEWLVWFPLLRKSLKLNCNRSWRTGRLQAASCALNCFVPAFKALTPMTGISRAPQLFKILVF
jgi:hypothetical protein